MDFAGLERLLLIIPFAAVLFKGVYSILTPWVEKGSGKSVSCRRNTVHLACHRTKLRVQLVIPHLLNTSPAGAPFLDLGVMRNVVHAINPAVLIPALPYHVSVVIEAHTARAVAVEDEGLSAHHLKPPDRRIVLDADIPSSMHGLSWDRYALLGDPAFLTYSHHLTGVESA